MQINGPLSIGVVEDPSAGSRELHIGFTPKFRALAPEQRHRELADHAAALQAAIDGLAADSADAQGMMLILQVVEQVLPYIEQDEIPLEEEIVVEVRPEFSLAGFVPGVDFIQ